MNIWLSEFFNQFNCLNDALPPYQQPSIGNLRNQTVFFFSIRPPYTVHHWFLLLHPDYASPLYFLFISSLRAYPLFIFFALHWAFIIFEPLNAKFLLPRSSWTQPLFHGVACFKSKTELITLTIPLLAPTFLCPSPTHSSTSSCCLRFSLK